MKINLSEIRIDGGTQSRAAIDQATVDEYAEAIRAGVKFPEVLVYFDGAAHWLVDGFHRYHAHRIAGKTGIDVIAKNGTQREAVLYSVGANVDHGLRRTNADKRKAVGILLADPEWTQYSDRKIADLCAVSNNFVGDVRRSLSSDDSEKPAERIVTTKHGTETRMNTANIGKKKPEPEPEAPDEDQLSEAIDMVQELESKNAALEVKVKALSTADKDRELAKQIDMRKDAERELGVKMDRLAERDAELKSWQNWFNKVAKITGLEKRSDVLKWIQERAK